MFAVYTLFEVSEASLEPPEYVLSHGVIGADESTCNFRGPTRRARAENLVGLGPAPPNAVHYTLDESRSAALAKRLLGGLSEPTCLSPALR